MVVYNPSSLAYITETRNNIPGTALDQALAFCKDASNNTYITGKAWNGTDFDIKTIKINSNYSLGWSVTLDPYNMDDAGTSITTDGSGNVIVGGYVTKANSIKDLVCIKYNPSTGAAIWSGAYYQTSKNTTGDAAVKKVCTNPLNDNIYFVAVETGISGMKQTLTGRLSETGELRWVKAIESSSSDVLPSDIEYDGSGGVYVISILDSVTNSYLTTHYSDLELDTTRKFVSGSAICKKRELLVSFRPDALKSSMINNESLEFGDISDFLTSAAYSTFITALDGICRGCQVSAVKVFDQKTTDTITVSRMGMNVPIPSFWTTLLLQFPNTINGQQAQVVLNALPNVVASTQVNNFMDDLSVPNDSLYSLQPGLHPVGIVTNAHVNVEDAWNLEKGKSFVKGGVFDTGVMYKHRDFGFVGPNYAPQNFGKIRGYHFKSGLLGGYSVAGGIDLLTTNVGITLDPTGHGTGVAGIIGAQRNNTSGVAGIAGGDGSVSNPGVSLYSLNTQVTNMYWLLKAMYATCLNNPSPTKPYNYGLHFSNHSYKMSPGWWPADSFPLLREQVHFANRMHITFIVSRGNDGVNQPTFPATYDSSWVISVSGTGTNGQFKTLAEEPFWNPSFGRKVDIAAPCLESLIQATWNDGSYNAFNGTSGSAPFVSGAVGLMMSYMNDTIDTYRNLAPEDCEFIINRAATDVNSPGYDSLTGYGRLNIGKAMRLIEKPNHILYHCGTNAFSPYSISKSVINNSNLVTLTEKYETPTHVVYNPGKYYVKTFQINATVNHYTFATDSMMYYWPRHSASYVYDLYNGQNKLDLHERVFITSLNGTTASLMGYIYQVRDSTNSTALGWWPCDTTFNLLSSLGLPLMEYSILSKNKAVGISEKNIESKVSACIQIQLVNSIL
jgi:hypothetical protein